MLRNLYTLSIFLFFLDTLKSQTFEIGLFGGVTGYNGDLTHHFIEFKELNAAGGIHAEYFWTKYFSVSFDGKIGSLSGNDKHAEKIAFQARNLNFHTTLLDASTSLVYYPLNHKSKNFKIINPFVTVGVSYFHFNPKAELNGITYTLQPQGTEGQGTSQFPERNPYSLNQFSIPMGVGFKFFITNHVNIALSATINKTFTDYIDDVSTTYTDQTILITENGLIAYELSNRTGEFLNTEALPYDENYKRGNAEINDWYGNLGITLSYLFGKNETYGTEESSLSCPHF